MWLLVALMCLVVFLMWNASREGDNKEREAFLGMNVGSIGSIGSIPKLFSPQSSGSGGSLVVPLDTHPTIDGKGTGGERVASMSMVEPIRANVPPETNMEVIMAPDGELKSLDSSATIRTDNGDSLDGKGEDEAFLSKIIVVIQMCRLKNPNMSIESCLDVAARIFNNRELTSNEFVKNLQIHYKMLQETFDKRIREMEM